MPPAIYRKAADCLDGQPAVRRRRAWRRPPAMARVETTPGARTSSVNSTNTAVAEGSPGHERRPVQDLPVTGKRCSRPANAAPKRRSAVQRRVKAQWRSDRVGVHHGDRGTMRIAWRSLPHRCSRSIASTGSGCPSSGWQHRQAGRHHGSAVLLSGPGHSIRARTPANPRSSFSKPETCQPAAARALPPLSRPAGIKPGLPAWLACTDCPISWPSGASGAMQHGRHLPARSRPASAQNHGRPADPTMESEENTPSPAAWPLQRPAWLREINLAPRANRAAAGAPPCRSAVNRNGDPLPQPAPPFSPISRNPLTGRSACHA